MSLRQFHQTLATADHHLSAFLMLGDPTPEISVRLAIAAVECGSTMLELGLPFSDPCADGPAIQAACLRSRRAGVSTPEALAILAEIHAACPDTPLNLLVYGNLVHALGYDRFCARAASAGASTLLVPDFPLAESAPLRAAATEHGLGYVNLVGPLTDGDRLARLDAATTGFIYLAGYQGVTGKAAVSADAVGSDETEQQGLVRRTVAAVTHPVCLGFGISAPHQVTAAFSSGADIVVVGSHLARAIARGMGGASGDQNGGLDAESIVSEFRSALAPLCAATLPTTQP